MVTAHHATRRFTAAILREFLTAAAAEPECVFTLHVGDGASERLLTVGAGGVRVLSRGERSGPDLASHLLEAKKVTVEGLHTALETARTSNCSLRQVLLEANLLSAPEYAAASHKLVRDEILELVLWEEAFVATYAGLPPPEAAEALERQALAASVEIAELAADVGRWIEAWAGYRKTLGGDGATLAITGPGRRAARAEGGALRRLLQDCARERKLRLIWRASGMDLPALCAELCACVEKRWITVVNLTVPQSPEEMQAAIAALEDGLASALGNSLVREKIVHQAERAKLAAKACEHLAVLAEEAFANHAAGVGCEYLRRILHLDPGNRSAFERLLATLLKQNQRSEVASLALAFAAELEKKKGAQEAMEDLVGTLRSLACPRDLMDEFLAGWFAGHGETQRAVSAYQSLATQCQQEGDWVRAAQLLKRGLVADPANAATQERVAGLKARMEPQASRRERERPATPGGGRALAACGIAGLVVLLVAGAIYWIVPFTREGWSLAFTGWPRASARPAAEAGPADGETPPPNVRARAVQAPPLVPWRAGAHKPAGAGAPPTGAAAVKAAERKTREKKPARPAIELPSPMFGPQLPPRELGEYLCRHSPPHALVTRPASDSLKVVFGASCDLRLVDTRLGILLHELKGGAGQRWCVGPGARVVCRWRPGDSPYIWRRSLARGEFAGWSLPADVEAVAVADELLAFRQGDVTVLAAHDGTALRFGRLPVWGEGVIGDDAFVVTPAAQGGREPPGVWVFDPFTLELLWSSAAPETWSGGRG